MLRRNFLLGTVALTAACSRNNNEPSLGSLAYIDEETLWLLDLPDGTPRRLAAGHRIGTPRFSPSGRWVSFQDDEICGIVSTDGKSRKRWKADSSERTAGHDELAFPARHQRRPNRKFSTPPTIGAHPTDR